MSAKEQAFRPSVSDAAVKAATGKDWAGWFDVLDKAKAASLSHKGHRQTASRSAQGARLVGADRYGEFRTRAGFARETSESGRILRRRVQNDAGRCRHALSRRCDHCQPCKMVPYRRVQNLFPNKGQICPRKLEE